MRKSWYLVALFSLLALGLVYGFEFFPVTSAQEKEKPKAAPVGAQPARVVKWEYKLIERPNNEKADETNAEINKLGDEGWELVNTYRDHAQSIHARFVFKRQKQ